MDPILDALHVALASYRDELATNEREADAASTYLHVLGKRHIYLVGQIHQLTTELATRKEEQSALTP